MQIPSKEKIKKIIVEGFPGFDLYNQWKLNSKLHPRFPYDLSSIYLPIFEMILGFVLFSLYFHHGFVFWTFLGFIFYYVILTGSIEIMLNEQAPKEKQLLFTLNNTLLSIRSLSYYSLGVIIAFLVFFL